MCATARIMSTNTRAAPEMVENDINGLMLDKIKNNSGISPNQIWTHMNAWHRSKDCISCKHFNTCDQHGGRGSPVIFVI